MLCTPTGYGVSPSGSGGSANSDNFNRNVVPMGGIWTDRVGGWGCTGTQAAVNTFVIGDDHATATCGADGTFQLTVAVGGSGGAGIIFRWSDTSNYWILSGEAGSGFKLVKVVAGAHSTIFSGGTFSNGDVIKVVCAGNGIDIYQNNILLTSTTIDSFNNTAIEAGVFAYYLGSGTSALDDWSYVP